MGLEKDLSLGGQGRDEEDRNDRTRMAGMETAEETTGLHGEQMVIWNALGERKSEHTAGKVRRDQNMKTCACHPTGIGKVPAPGWQDACSGAMHCSSAL